MWIANVKLKPDLILRTFRRSYQYKPKDKHVVQDIVESFASKDVILFRYENPKRIIWINLGCGLLFAAFSFQAYTMYDIGDVIKPNRKVADEKGRAWMVDNVLLAANGVSVAFFLFGACLCSYWLIRNLYTVRRVILRKGGQSVVIVSYGLTGVRSRLRIVPLNQVKLRQ